MTQKHWDIVAILAAVFGVLAGSRTLYVYMKKKQKQISYS